TNARDRPHARYRPDSPFLIALHPPRYRPQSPPLAAPSDPRHTGRTPFRRRTGPPAGATRRTRATCPSLFHVPHHIDPENDREHGPERAAKAAPQPSTIRQQAGADETKPQHRKP